MQLRILTAIKLIIVSRTDTKNLLFQEINSETECPKYNLSLGVTTACRKEK
jgi:hypothetical protein